MTKGTQNGTAEVVVELVEASDFEVAPAVLGLIGDVLTASPAFATLAQRLVGIAEGKGYDPETPMRLVVTSARVEFGPPPSG